MSPAMAAVHKQQYVDMYYNDFYGLRSSIVDVSK